MCERNENVQDIRVLAAKSTDVLQATPDSVIVITTGRPLQIVFCFSTNNDDDDDDDDGEQNTNKKRFNYSVPLPKVQMMTGFWTHVSCTLHK